MGMFDFGKKKEQVSMDPNPQQPMGVGGLPVNQVMQLKQQGANESQIIQTLQRDGYKSHQIFDAMNQAELTSGSPRHFTDMPVPIPEQSVQGGSQYPQQQAPFEQQMGIPPYPSRDQFPSMPQHERMQPQQDPMFLQPMPSPAMSAQPVGLDTASLDRIEEIAESIVEEKWTELARGVAKIAEWKEKSEGRLVEMETRISQLEKRFEELNKGVLGKLTDYDKSISSVGTDVKAMEKAFQQMLPTFTENVNELSRLTKGIKSKKEQ